MAASKVCLLPDCPNLATRYGRCEAHQRPRKPDNRPNAAQRGYNKDWQVVRAEYLAYHANCANPYCSNAATEVDHIVSLRKGGTHEYNNLRAYCKPCHSRKTAKVDGSFGRGVDRGVKEG